MHCSRKIACPLRRYLSLGFQFILRSTQSAPAQASPPRSHCTPQTCMSHRTSRVAAASELAGTFSGPVAASQQASSHYHVCDIVQLARCLGRCVSEVGVSISRCLQVEVPVALRSREILQDRNSNVSFTVQGRMNRRPPVLRPSEAVTVPPAQVRVVTTAAELQAASVAGAQDIEIRTHLDLSGLKRFVNPALSAIPKEDIIRPQALLYTYGNMRSMRVRARRWHFLVSCR